MLKYSGEIVPSIVKERKEQLHHFKTMAFEISINVTQENSSNEVDSIQITSIQELKFGDKVAKKKFT